MIPGDLSEPISLDWLQTDEGVAWLDSVAGIRWLTSGSGEDWLGSRAGRAWIEDGQDDRWAAYFSNSGSVPNPPAWALNSETAPRAGARVRFKSDARTMTGVEFREGELAVVVEARFTPIGVVAVTVRTLDGRTRSVTLQGELELA
jgi:hypothetical protein